MSICLYGYPSVWLSVCMAIRLYGYPSIHPSFGIFICLPIKKLSFSYNPQPSDFITNKTNSVVLVRKRTIPTERPPHKGEVSVNFCGERVSRGQRNGSPRPYSRFSRPEPLLFLPSSSSIVLARLSGPLSGPTTSQKIW
jgi:hypothetical protein